MGIGEAEGDKIRRVDPFFAKDFEAPAWRCAYVEIRKDG